MLRSHAFFSSVLTLFFAFTAHAAWSPITSEEYPPITCSNGYLIGAYFCSGDNCDNQYIRCDSTGRTYGTNSWTSFFSEEATNYRICAGSAYVTGIACQGGNCDNISLQCTTITGAGKNGCYWTPFFSEEEGYMYLNAGYYAAGIQCRGSRCDDKSIYACRP